MSLITDHNPSRRFAPASSALSTRCEPLVRTTNPGPLLRGLLAEWEAANTSPRTLRRANSWGLPGDPVDRLDEMVARAGFGGPADCDTADGYLLGLVGRAAHDQLAARIVLQRVLPPVISIARRRGKTRPGGIESALGDLVAQAWMVISTYPTERRPRKVAANLVRDIEYHEYVATNRPRKTVVEFVDHGRFTAGNFGMLAVGIDPPAEDDAVRNLMLELEVRNVSPLRRTIVGLACAGWSCAEIGRHLGMPERTVRWNRTEALAEASSYLAEIRPASSQGGGPQPDAAV